jgi:Zn finger protein HypA/HybF involved in hydrogenase expression
MTGFAECTKCDKWSSIPKEFKETLHFVQCPVCKSAMFLVRGVDPKEVALRPENMVVAGIMKQ